MEASHAKMEVKECSSEYAGVTCYSIVSFINFLTAGFHGETVNNDEIPHVVSFNSLFCLLTVASLCCVFVHPQHRPPMPAMQCKNAATIVGKIL